MRARYQVSTTTITFRLRRLHQTKADFLLILLQPLLSVLASQLFPLFACQIDGYLYLLLYHCKKKRNNFLINFINYFAYQAVRSALDVL